MITCVTSLGVTYMPLRVAAFSSTGIFLGASVDFDLSWYMQIGLALSNTMLLNSVATQLPFLVVELCVLPIYRSYRAVVRVSQLHLNKVFAPSEFRLHTRMATMMNTLIITLFFSPALPILIPFALIFFIVSMVVDKLLVFRCCQKPPAYDARLVSVAIQMLPFLLMCHLVLAIWTYGNADFFASGVWRKSSFGKDTYNVYQQLESSSTKVNTAAIASRIFRYNTLPFSVLFALLLLAKIFALIGLDVFGATWQKIVLMHKKCCGGRRASLVQDEDDLRSPKGTSLVTKVNNHPPFSCRFEVLYKDPNKVPAFSSDR